MKISTRVRYGLRMMIELAMSASKDYIPLSKIAENQSISPKYLKQISLVLENYGLVKSMRGIGGGYKLSRPPEEITVHEIVEALMGKIEVVDCVSAPELCELSEKCAAREVWVEISEAVSRLLKEKTLKELADRQKELLKEVK